MELIKKNVHMNKLKCKTNVQLTMDDDFNVPDVKPDIEQIIKDRANIILQDIKTMNGKVVVKGVLSFHILYISDGTSNPVHNISGELPFEELINMDDACSEDVVAVKWDIDDLTTSLINSRKLSVKSIVTFTLTSEDSYDEEAAISVDGDGNCHSKYKDLNITQLMLNKKDTFRVKDEIHIPNGKRNISEILFSEIEPRELDIRLTDDAINVRGILLVFVLYIGDTEEQGTEYFETEIPFNNTIECNGCKDGMISNIRPSLINQDLQVKADDDGEERIISCEAVFELDIKAYEDEDIEILSDCYSTAKEVVPSMKTAYFEQLLTKNNSKLRASDRLNIGTGQPGILQICNASGSVRIDEEMIIEDGIEVDGVLDVQILYISDDDAKPIGSTKGTIPFSQVVEVKGIGKNCNYEIFPSVEQISVIMLDSEEIEVKASINLDTIAFLKLDEPIIVDLEESDFDLEKLQKLPGIVGYIVKIGDSMWDIAKKFHTTVDSIMKLNELETEELEPGDKLLLLKKVDAI